MKTYVFTMNRKISQWVDVAIKAESMKHAEEIMEQKSLDGDICWCDKCVINESIQDEFIYKKYCADDSTRQCFKDYFVGCGRNE